MSLGDLFYTVASMGGRAFAAGFVMCFFALPLDFSGRVPRRVEYAMLFLVVFRLLCPVSLSSRWSIFNVELVRELEDLYSLADTLDHYTGDYEVAIQGTDAYQEALDAGLTPEEDIPYAICYIRDGEGRLRPPVTAREAYGRCLGVIWLVGVGLFGAYGLGSYLWLRRKVATATWVEDNVYETDRIRTPFILGFRHPKIYLPLHLDGEQRRYVLCHEREHLRHGDHIAKALVYALMCVHWFNWALWFYFYRMFSSVLEEACDADTLGRLGEEAKAAYGEALVHLSGRRGVTGAIPCAFGEGDTRERVKKVLRYRKPTAWGTVGALLLLAAAAVLTGTNAVGV